MKQILFAFAALVTICSCGVLGISNAQNTQTAETAIAAVTSAAAAAQQPTFTPTPTVAPTLPLTVTSTAVPTLPPTPTPTSLPQASISVDRVSLRSGPGKEYAIVAQSAKGDHFSVRYRSPDNGWIQVVLPAGKTAWAPLEAVQFTDGQALALETSSDFPPPPPMIKNWQGDPVRTVCLNLQGKYAGQHAVDYPEEVFQPGDLDYDAIFQTTERFLTDLGLQVQPAGGECHAELNIQLTLNRLSDLYINDETKENVYCYSGSSIQGFVTLKSEKGYLTYNNKKIRPNDLHLTGCWETSPVQGEAKYVILKSMRSIWGIEVLRSGLKDNQTDLLNYTLKDIQALGKAAQTFVPDLIQLFEDSDSADQAAETLKIITGMDFGVDVTAWQEWWSSQQ